MSDYYLGVVSGIGGVCFIIGLANACGRAIPPDIIFYVGLVLMLIGAIAKIHGSKRSKSGA